MSHDLFAPERRMSDRFPPKISGPKMSGKHRTKSHGKKDYEPDFRSLQKELIDAIHKHPSAHETMGGVRGLVDTPDRVFRGHKRFEHLYVFLREINPGVRELDVTTDDIAKKGFREAILTQPNGGSRARILSILLDLDVDRNSETWTNFAKHLNVQEPSSACDEQHKTLWKELRDEKLPLSLDMIEDIFGEQHSHDINEMQYKYCVPLTENYGEVARELETAISKTFVLPKDDKNIPVREVHVEYFCPDPGPAQVVQSNSELVTEFFVQCRLARILSFGTKRIAKQYELKRQAGEDAMTFLEGVKSRAKILAILLHIGLYGTDDAWDQFFSICLGFSPSRNDADDEQDRSLAGHIDSAISDQALPLRDAASISEKFGLLPHHAMKFLRSQYLFCAALLKEGEQRDLTANTFLPLSRKEEIGGGAYGKVYGVTIVEQHIDAHGELNDKPKDLAMKRSSPDGPNDWDELRWILKQPLTHKHIATARAALKSKTDNFVFFDRADSDLRKFMGEEEHWKLWAGDIKGKLTVLKSITQIANAIEYLHVHLKNEHGHSIVCYHRDLRADNILVKEQDDELLFKITDFGLSTIQGTLENQHYPQLSRDLAHDLTGLPIGRSCSNFPPEALNGKIDSGADIWAFGTVFAEFIAWLAGGSEKLKEYMEARQAGGYEWSFEIGQDGRPIPRKDIEAFFTKLIAETSDEREHRLYASSWRLLQEKLLICKPIHRAGIQETVKILHAICEEKETSSIIKSKIQENGSTRRASSGSETPRARTPQLPLSRKSNSPIPGVATSKTFAGFESEPPKEGSPSKWNVPRKKPKGKESEQHAEHVEFAPVAIVEKEEDTQSLIDSRGLRNGPSRREERPSLTLTNQVSRKSTLDSISRSDWHAGQQNMGDVVEDLIQQGADLDETDKRGHTFLMRAVSSGNEYAAAMLLDHEADMTICNHSGWSVLHYATKLKSTRIPERILEEHDWLKNQRNNQGRTPLHECARRCTKESLQLAEVLIRFSCDVDAADDKDRTPLSLATERAASDASREMVRMLRAEGATFGSGIKGAEYKQFHDELGGI